jgi:hypothetical protein
MTMGSAIGDSHLSGILFLHGSPAAGQPNGVVETLSM